jgi:hypothetical protein
MSPKGTGFYFGGDLYIGIPVIPSPSVAGEIWPMYLSLKVPLGRRWPGERRSMGFYLGGGPEFQVMTDFTSFTEWYVSLFLDLGWQTNKTEGVGFHFGFQLSVCPYKWMPYNPFLWFPIPTFATVFHFGVSWRRPVRNGDGEPPPRRP